MKMVQRDITPTGVNTYTDERIRQIAKVHHENGLGVIINKQWTPEQMSTYHKEREALKSTT